MADITFDAKLREKAGKGAARACRREGRVPAVVYGGNKEALMISLDPVQLEKALDMVGFYDADIEINLDGKKLKFVCQARRLPQKIKLQKAFHACYFLAHVSKCTRRSKMTSQQKPLSILLVKQAKGFSYL